MGIAHLFDLSDGEVLAGSHFIAHEILENDADFLVQVFEIVFAKIDAIQQDLSFARIIQLGNQFYDVCLALPVLADERNPLSGMEVKVEVIENSPRTSWIMKGDVDEFEATDNRTRRWQRVWLRFDGRPHFEEGQQIRKKQRLVGNAGERRKYLLDVAARLLNGTRKKGQGADAESAQHCAPDHVGVRGVVAHGA